MAFKLIWSPRAKFDIKNIAAFIAEDNVAAAERFIENIFQTVERLTDFPESGRIVPEFGDTAIREVIFKPLRIVYRVDIDRHVIDIARVWHAARGIPDIE